MEPGNRARAGAGGRSTLSLLRDEPASGSEPGSGGRSGSTSRPSSGRSRRSRFAPALRRIGLELALPEPARSRVLIEMASDLDSLFEHYLALGLSEEEAAGRAERKVLASPQEVQRLVAVHTTGAARWAAWLTGRVRRDLDLFLFLAGVVPVLAMAALLLTREIALLRGSPFAWAVLGIGIAILGLSARRFHQLFLRGDEAPEELRAGLSGLLCLGAAGPTVAALGLLVHLHALFLSLARGGGSPDWVRAAEEIGRGAALLGTGILLGLAAGLLWFILASRVVALERAESIFLLDE